MSTGGFSNPTAAGVAPDRSEHSRRRRAPFDRAPVWPDPLVRRATRV